jgi:hypothetical protein
LIKDDTKEQVDPNVTNLEDYESMKIISPSKNSKETSQQESKVSQYSGKKKKQRL